MATPFPINPALMAIAIAFSNARMIADLVLPRTTVGKQEFRYLKHTLAEGFTIPDTKVGRKSKPSTVEFTAAEVTDSTLDYGLDDPIPQSDLDNAPEGYDPKGRAVEGIMNLVELDREVRTASLVLDASQYGADNKVTLSGTDQFSDYDNSDPVGVFQDALDAMVMRANKVVFGRPAFTKFASHPAVVSAVLGNSGTKGIATRQQIADLFELEEVLVGEAWVNNARKGQAMSLSRTWGKDILLFHQDANADLRSGATFGATAQFGSRIAGSQPDPNIGLRGGENVRAGESVKEVIMAAELGYLIKDAVA